MALTSSFDQHKINWNVSF